MLSMWSANRFGQFPAFFFFDTGIDTGGPKIRVWDAIVSSCGYGMMIMILLDAVRLYLDIPLVVGSSNLVCSLTQ